MKNIMFMIAGLLVALTLIIGIMSVTGRNAREKEQTESLSQAMRETIDDLSVTGVYTIDNEEEFKADFIQALVDKLKLSGVKSQDGSDTTVVGDKNMTLQIDFAEVDSENELLMVHVKEKFSYVFGIEGQAEDSAVIIFSEEENVNLHTIRYTMSYDESVTFHCAPDFKGYEQEENEFVKSPSSPVYYEDYDPDNPDSAADEVDYNWVCTDSSAEDEIAIGECLEPWEIRKRKVKGDYEFAFSVSDRPRKVYAWMNGEKTLITVPYREDVLPYLNALSPEDHAPSGYAFIGWVRSTTADAWENNNANAPEDNILKSGQEIAVRSNRNYYALYGKSSVLRITYHANGGSPDQSQSYSFRDICISNRTGGVNNFYYTYNGNASLSGCARIWHKSRYLYMSIRMPGGPSRSGYNFIGWSTNPRATTASWGGNTNVRVESFISGASTLNADIYALWRPAGLRISASHGVGCQTSGNSITYWTTMALTSDTLNGVRIWYADGSPIRSISFNYSYQMCSAGMLDDKRYIFNLVDLNTGHYSYNGNTSYIFFDIFNNNMNVPARVTIYNIYVNGNPAVFQ